MAIERITQKADEEDAPHLLSLDDASLLRIGGKIFIRSHASPDSIVFPMQAVENSLLVHISKAEEWYAIGVIQMDVKDTDQQYEISLTRQSYADSLVQTRLFQNRPGRLGVASVNKQYYRILFKITENSPRGRSQYRDIVLEGKEVESVLAFFNGKDAPKQ